MRMKKIILLSVLFAACGGSSTTEIQNLGSDTMVEVAGAWAETYHKAHPEIVVSVSGGGSGNGVSALINGDVDIANCSRPMKDKEIAAAKEHGHQPIQHEVGKDCIAIFVHKDNPIESLTLDQLAQMFGDGGKLTKWSDLGLKFAGEADPIVLVSRQNNSGTYECFREMVLGGDKGRFKAECNNLNGSKDVVDFCSKTKSAIGYSGLAYATPEVRIVPVVNKQSGKPIMPSTAAVRDGSYPIARSLWMYTIGEPTGATKQYLDWIKGQEGQAVLANKHYIPLY